MTQTKRISLVIDARAIELGADGSLPSEFRIFRAGLNKTRKGNFLFDDQAARDVMTAYEAHGVDGMIDLEHLSLNQESKNFDPDARGWCRLSLRNGELWAVDVKWTEDGARRLTSRTQRYVSPVFDFDEKTRRVSEIHNIALTAMPATDAPQSLVAATERVNLMADSKEGAETEGAPGIDALLKVLGLGPDSTIFDVIGAVKKLQTAGEPDGDEGGDEGGEEMRDAPPAPPGSPVPPKPDKKADAAMRREIFAVTATASHAEALKSIGRMKEAYVTLSDREARLTKDKEALEKTERHQLVTEMVALGAEFPANAWVEVETADPAVKAHTPAEPWASLKIEALRARVETLRAANPAAHATAKPPHSPSNGDASPIPGLTGAQYRSCLRMGFDPNKYAEKLRANDARKGR